MFFQITEIACLILFYGFYIAKIISQKKRSIKTNQMGIGNKSPKVLLIERIMSFATVLTIIIEVCSIFAVKNLPMEPIRVLGLLIGIIAVIIFGASTIIMKDSWRVGISEERTTLVTNGIYQWSRNPAFLGFDLLYLSMCLLFFNVPLLVVSVWAAIMLHLQILQEEKHLQQTFGDEYILYMQHTLRYLGKR